MKLTELDPRWFEARFPDGEDHWAYERAGFTFICPHCRAVRLTCTTRRLTMTDQMRALAAAHPGNGGNIVPGGHVWSVVGEDFASLTVIPSIDASPAGHWHGWITLGEVLYVIPSG